MEHALNEDLFLSVPRAADGRAEVAKLGQGQRLDHRAARRSDERFDDRRARALVVGGDR
ncbi:MAG: hypothetical protein U0269_18390 [Polyangiales bacterium]